MNTLLVSTSLLIASMVSQADSFQSSTELVGSRRGAAAFAGIAAGMTDEELTRELASHVQPPGQHPQQEKQKETVS